MLRLDAAADRAAGVGASRDFFDQEILNVAAFLGLGLWGSGLSGAWCA
jgi:hypothetical protein